jgi:hypothetical protein
MKSRKLQCAHHSVTDSLFHSNTRREAEKEGLWQGLD